MPVQITKALHSSSHMLPLPTSELPKSSNWTHELKLDGYTGSQFLKVIESVVSGMARGKSFTTAIILRLGEATLAVDRYIKERNDHFSAFLKRAGDKDPTRPDRVLRRA